MQRNNKIEEEVSKKLAPSIEENYHQAFKLCN